MKKHILKLLALLLCLSLLCAVCAPAFADWGDYAGDDDYGGWDDDDGGGWDWGGWDDDDGGGWDWGGNDNDYNYSWSDSSDRSSGGGSVPGGVIIAVVVIGIIILIIRAVAASSEGGGSVGGSDSYEDSYEYRNNAGKEDFNPSRVRTRAPSGRPVPKEYRDLKDIDSYAGIDPGFSASKLKQKLSNLYIQMQQCWQDKNIESLRPYFTDAYFTQIDRQLDVYRRKGLTNYVERPVVLSVTLDGFCQEEGEDHIYATVNTRIVDYTLNDATGKLVSGSQKKEKFMTYRYHLTRPTGQHSDVGSGVRSVSCPNCGAPLSINESAKCPYCGSVVTVDAHEFVIAQIEGVAQRTV